MNKYELMENYTMEQLAEMVVKLQEKKDSENKSFKIPFAKRCDDELEKFLKENPLQNSIEKICKDIQQQKDNYMAMEFTKSICELLRKNGVIINCTENRFEYAKENSIEERYGVIFDSVDFSEHDKEFTDEIDKLKIELHSKETTINQIDEILKELFNVTFEICETEEDFAGLKKCLEKNIKTASISDFLPAEPIEVAGMLINEKIELIKSTDGIETEIKKSIFDISELRQIAEHLLVYCNANESEE